MARPLRIERVGGRYHATARGNERRNIFRDDTDHFLELLSEMPERFGSRLPNWGSLLGDGLLCGKRSGAAFQPTHREGHKTAT